MYRLRTVEGLTLDAIGKRFGVGPERVRQLINRHIHQTTGQIPNPGQISRTASEIRRRCRVPGLGRTCVIGFRFTRSHQFGSTPT
jgi:hypothetical protein